MRYLLIAGAALLCTAAHAGEVTYSEGMKAGAIAADRANRAELAAMPRPHGVNDVYCPTEDFRFGKGWGYNYAGSDPDPNIRTAMLRACNNPGGDSGVTAAATK